MWTRLLSNRKYSNISNSLRNLTCSKHEIRHDTRLTFGMYTFPCSVVMSLIFWGIRLDDECFMWPKHVAVIGLVIIKFVCRRTTSLLLRIIQTQEGCHTLKKTSFCPVMECSTDEISFQTIQVSSSRILNLQVSLSVVNFRHLCDY
jgi:hypothetical protein